MTKTLTVGFILLAILSFFAGVIVLSQKYLANAENNPSQDCSKYTTKIYTADIRNGNVLPSAINAKLCDQLTITNNDERVRIIAFGVHERHTPYGGVEEQILHNGQSFTITLDKTGSYIFHDHDQETVQGSFSVSSR